VALSRSRPVRTVSPIVTRIGVPSVGACSFEAANSSGEEGPDEGEGLAAPAVGEGTGSFDDAATVGVVVSPDPLLQAASETMVTATIGSPKRDRARDGNGKERRFALIMVVTPML
jgi:hypothetical protein